MQREAMSRFVPSIAQECTIVLDCASAETRRESDRDAPPPGRFFTTNGTIIKNNKNQVLVNIFQGGKMKNVLVVGSGGREHALVWQLKRSPQVGKVFCAPGNAGIAADAECVDIKVNELEKLADFAQQHKVDLTVVGPEAPLCDGIVDVFQARKLAIFGPDKEAAQLEGSKDYAKRFMVKYGIPTAQSETFEDADSACEYIEKQFAAGKKGIVVKADGLAAGKGVLVAENLTGAVDFVREECFGGAFGAAGTKVVIEEMLTGEEASILALVDGKTIVSLVSSQDHKRIYNNDLGPNTGGMGAYSPAPVVTPEVAERVEKEILQPFLKGINEEKLNFRGVIFCGLMIENDIPKVLEFNVRFGDPEIQPVMRRFEGDWYDVLRKVVDGKLADAELKWSKDAAISVVMASGGYPGKYAKGFPISGLEQAAQTGAVVFHCGTAKKGGEIVTDGGRVLGVSATGRTIREAIMAAYYAVPMIQYDNVFYRNDIGRKALVRKEKPIKSKALAVALIVGFALFGCVLSMPWGINANSPLGLTIIKFGLAAVGLARLIWSFAKKKLTVKQFVVTSLTFLLFWFVCSSAIRR